MKCEVTKLGIGEECNVVIPLREFVKARDDKSEMRYLSELTHMYMAVHDISIFMYDDWYAGILSWFDDTMLDSVDIVFAVVEYDWVYYFYVYDNREDKYHMLLGHDKNGKYGVMSK